MGVPDPSPKLYTYRATVVSAHDGDSVKVDIDLGCSVWLHDQDIRLLGLNAPEITGKQKAEGAKSRVALLGLLAGLTPVPHAQAPDAMVSKNHDRLDFPVVLETVKDEDEKFGRLLGKIYAKKTDGTWICINDEMIRLGYAKPYSGKGERPA